MQLFEHILLCWTEYEIFYTLEHSKHVLQCTDNDSIHSFAVPTEKAEIIKDVRYEKRLFKVAHHDQPLLLTDAIVYSNLLQFVKGKGWFEMLPKLDLSRTGTHFVFFINDGDYPLLMSTALLLPFKRKDEWLSFNSFFQNKNWKLNITPQEIVKFSKNNKHSIDVTKLSDIYQSVKSFDDAMISAIIDKNAIAEIIRFTVITKNQRDIFKYLCKIERALLLQMYDILNIQLTFWVSERFPMYEIMNAVNLNTGENTSILIASYNDTDNNAEICKGIVANKKSADCLLTLSTKEIFKTIAKCKQ